MGSVDEKATAAATSVTYSGTLVQATLNYKKGAGRGVRQFILYIDLILITQQKCVYSGVTYVSMCHYNSNCNSNEPE